MTLATLKKAIQATEENAAINRGDWSSWSSSADISEAYSISLDADDARVLDRAISTNGLSLPSDLRSIELAELGQNFSGSGVAVSGQPASAAAHWIDVIERKYSKSDE